MTHSGNQLLIIYKSVTGFTREYAEMIAEEMAPEADCTLMDLGNVTTDIMQAYGTVIFGGRLHGGRVDGLEKFLELSASGGASRLLVYATGAAPAESQNVIEEMWKDNLTADQLQKVPHFYMPGGLRYERMPWFDKVAMRLFAAIMKKKKDKSPSEEQLTRMITSSYDISSRDYIYPLVSLLKARDAE